MVISGKPGSVLDRLVAVIDEIGWFGTLLLLHKDWDRPDLHRRSMRLPAERVMPKFRAYLAEREAAD
jgi:hypothetical protein